MELCHYFALMAICFYVVLPLLISLGVQDEKSSVNSECVRAVTFYQAQRLFPLSTKFFKSYS
jgi:hypothetical protein